MYRAAIFLLLFSTLNASGQYPEAHEVFSIKWENYVGITTFRTGIKFHNGKLYIPSNGEARNQADDPADGLYILNGTYGRIENHINVDGESDEDCNGVVIEEGHIYFGGDNGRFYCYNLDGQKVWEYIIHANTGEHEKGNEDDVEGVPVLADVNGDGTKDVAFNVESQGLYVVNGIDGELIWKFIYEDYEGSYMNSPACADLNDDGVKDFVIGAKRDEDPEIRWDYQNAVYGINGKTGKPLWQYNTHSNVHASPVILNSKYGMRIVIAESYSDVTYLTKAGNFRKFVNLNRPEGGISGLFATPVITDNNKLVIGTSWWGRNDGIWVCDLDRENFTTAADGLVELKADARTYIPAGPVSSSAVVADVLNDYKGKEIIVCSEQGQMHIFSADGELKQRLELPAGVEATPYVGDVDNDGKLDIIICCLNGKVYCYGTNVKEKKNVYIGSFRGENDNDGVLNVKRF